MSLGDDPTSRILLDAALAIGIGLFVGLEREHSDVSGHQEVEARDATRRESLLGVRTFGLLALFGWVAAYTSTAHPWLPVVALVVVGCLVAISALREHELGHGLTTEVAALTTLVLGMLVHHQRAVAVALALATTLLLLSKPWFRALVPRLRRVDLTATLQLLVLLAIVLPLLPPEARDPWRVLSPRRIGTFIALTAGIGYIGYVSSRLLGGRRGAGITGLVGGLVSSTAVTAAMAQHARGVPAMLRPGQLATLVASTVMLARVLVVSVVINPRMTRTLALPLGAMMACMALGSFWKWRQLQRSAPDSMEAGELELQNPFSLLPALKWGALYAGILLASALARETFGDYGFVATAAVSGFVDVDAVTLAASRLAADAELGMAMAGLAITVAVASNTIAKGAIAWMVGGRPFGADIAKVFAGAMGVGLLVATMTAAL